MGTTCVLAVNSRIINLHPKPRGSFRISITNLVRLSLALAWLDDFRIRGIFEEDMKNMLHNLVLVLRNMFVDESKQMLWLNIGDNFEDLGDVDGDRILRLGLRLRGHFLWDWRWRRRRW